MMWNSSIEVVGKSCSLIVLVARTIAYFLWGIAQDKFYCTCQMVNYNGNSVLWHYAISCSLKRHRFEGKEWVKTLFDSYALLRDWNIGLTKSPFEMCLFKERIVCNNDNYDTYPFKYFLWMFLSNFNYDCI